MPEAIEKVLFLVYSKILQFKSNQNMMEGSRSLSPGQKRDKRVEKDYAKELSSQLADREMVIKELRETIDIL